MSLLKEYMDAKANLDHYKKLEGKLRIELLEEAFPNAAVDGTCTMFEDGYKVKGAFKLGYKLDWKSMAESIPEIDMMEALPDLTTAEAECITLKPTLSLSAYKKLDETERERLDAYITVAPAMPTISIEMRED